MAQSASAWSAVMTLASRNHHAIAIDLPGIGRACAQAVCFVRDFGEVNPK